MSQKKKVKSPERSNKKLCTVTLEELADHDKLSEETTSCTYSDSHNYLVWCDARFTGNNSYRESDAERLRIVLADVQLYFFDIYVFPVKQCGNTGNHRHHTINWDKIVLN